MNLVFLVPSLSIQLLFRLEGLWSHILVVITLHYFVEVSQNVLFCSAQAQILCAACLEIWDVGKLLQLSRLEKLDSPYIDQSFLSAI